MYQSRELEKWRKKELVHRVLDLQNHLKAKGDCSCYNQIVWFFDKPTVLVCEECERTFHCSEEKCNSCGIPLTSFVKEEK